MKGLLAPSNCVFLSGHEERFLGSDSRDGQMPSEQAWWGFLSQEAYHIQCIMLVYDCTICVYTYNLYYKYMLFMFMFSVCICIYI